MFTKIGFRNVPFFLWEKRFWVLAGIFIVASLLFILPTLLRNKESTTDIVRNSTNVSIYQDQIAELDNDLQNDILNQEQYNQSKHELQKRMMLDMPDQNFASKQIINIKQGIATPIVIALIIPVSAISLYLFPLLWCPIASFRVVCLILFLSDKKENYMH